MRLIDVDALKEKLGITLDCDECEYSSCGFLCTKTRDFVDACEAIQAAPIVEECEDAISRSALIDAHYEYCNEHSNDYCAQFYTWSLKLMENAPSVQPRIDKDYLVNLILESVYDGDACKRLLDLVDRPKGK